ncbi:MAG: hypothetical protein WA821_10775, partial [Anaerolineales bacterium]
MRYRKTQISAFIPCTHATALVFYYSWWNGGKSKSAGYVDQFNWCNSFAVASVRLYDIQSVVLANTNEAAGTRQIAWDEIWDYVLP